MTLEALAELVKANQREIEKNREEVMENRKENKEEHAKVFDKILNLEIAIVKINGKRIETIEDDVRKLIQAQSERIGAAKFLTIICMVAGAVSALVSFLVR